MSLTAEHFAAVQVDKFCRAILGAPITTEQQTMKLTSAHKFGATKKSRRKEQARVQTVILPLVCFVAGVVVTVLWFQFGPEHHAENSKSQTSTPPVSEQPAERPINPNRPARPFTPSHPPVNSSAIEEVKQAVPNYASVSLADGIQALREAALKKFTAATKDTDIQIKQARQQLIEAQKSQSAPQQASSRKHLQQVQAEAAEKLQDIAGELQTQIAALKQLKGTAQ